jgi:small subunit ribosomal protein S14
MKNSLKKDLIIRQQIRRLEHKRLLYKSIIKDQTLPQELRYDFILKLNKLPRQSSMIKKNNRCVLTGRTKGTLRYFKVSRICLRELVASGSLPGVLKASW